MTTPRGLQQVFDGLGAMTPTDRANLARVSPAVEQRTRDIFAAHVKTHGIRAINILPLPRNNDTRARVLILADFPMEPKTQSLIARLAHQAIAGHYKPAEISIIPSSDPRPIDMADHVVYERFHVSQYYANPTPAPAPWACSLDKRYPSCYIAFG